MEESNPLVLEILSQDKTLKMSLFEQRELASTLRHYSQCQVSSIEIGRLCQEVVYVLNKAGEKGGSDPDLVRSLKKTGQLLWDHLLTRQVKAKLRTTHISDLILCIDEELINIPWELLNDGTNFLCLNFNLGRVVRTKEQSSPVQYRSASSTLKMIILANPTNDLKSAYQEGINIRNQFDRRRGNVRIDFKSTSIDKIYVKKNLRDYDIVHFAGHCEYSADNPRHSGWVLNDGRFSVHDILAMGSDEPFPTLIFSNACYSAKTPSYLIDTDYQEKNYSLASAFLFSGVRHYIGAIRRIEDKVSLNFSKEFYSHLISGKSVGDCLRLSRMKLIKEEGIANIAWASYLLYGDPNYVLFRAPAKQARPKKKKIVLSKAKIAAICLSTIILSSVIYFSTWLPTLNPSAFALFLSAQKLSQKGSNQEAITLSNRLIVKDSSFLAVYPFMGDTYLRLGDMENALKNYFAYARLSEKKNDAKNLCASYIKIGWFYQMQGQFPKAFDFYNKALSLSRKNKDMLNEAIALRKLAVWYIDKNDYNQALELLTKSSEINRQRQNIYAHRYNLACDYFDFGLVFSDKDDFATAVDFYQKSRKIFEKLKLKDELSDYYFNLGEIYLFEKQYQKALDSYLVGLKIDQQQNNKMNLGADLNMIGELYMEMDNLKEAQNYFDQAAGLLKELGLPADLAQSYHNLGLLYKKQGKKNKARENLRLAQEIYSQIDTASYQEVKLELMGLSSN